MLEMEEKVGAFDHWRALGSSKPVFEALNDEKSDDFFVNSQKKFEQVKVSDTGAPMEGLRSKGISIAERRAAKCGFNAVSISTARFRSTSPLASPAARSPYLTIPAGISPTALLDSPVMLHNSQALPSPTTGTFTFPPFNHESLMPNSVAPAEDGDEGSDIGSFRFKPHGSPVSLPYISGFQPPMDFEFPAEFPTEADTKNCAPESSTDIKVSKDSILNASTLALQQSHIDMNNRTPQYRDSEPIHGEDSRGQHFLGDQKETYPPVGTIRTSEDGYNWRKYGQKQVKGSEYPRSYFKCTHQNCPVKKKVERSHDGQITEIIYKGAHNHPKPQPNRRSILGSPFSVSEMSEMGEGTGSCVKVEGGSVWRNIQLGCKDIKVGSDRRADGLERETSAVTEISDPLSTTQGKSMGVFESVGTPEFSSTLGSHADYDDDGATKGIISPGDDADDEEPESKRMKKESCLVETNMASRAVREPRVVVQIESDVDILDDGYRWRKYGQKVVKGNPNPRSYYKCTSAGCSVRKHVERASHNLKCVITTYEGKHNHEVPVARNSSHSNSGSGSLPLATSNAQPSLTLPRNANIPKPETQVQDLSLHFERKPEMGHEFMSPGLLGNFGSDMKFEPSSIYQMRFPTLQNTMPYGSIAPVLSDFPMSMSLTIPRSGNMVMGGFDFNNQVRPIGPAQSFLGGQQFRENDTTKLLKPKQEQRDETIYNTYPPNAGHTSGSSSSMYCRIMGSLPS